MHILDRNINRAGQVWATKLFRYIERVKGWDQKGSLHAMHACVRCARHRRSCVMRGSVNICLERIIRKQSMQNHMAYSKHTKNQPHACPCKLLSTNHEWFSNFTIHGFHRAKLYIYIYISFFHVRNIYLYIWKGISGMENISYPNTCRQTRLRIQTLNDQPLLCAAMVVFNVLLCACCFAAAALEPLVWHHH